jgi:hypothetical protein
MRSCAGSPSRSARFVHSLTLCIALIWAITVFLWIGDLKAAEDHIDRLISRSESYSMPPYVAAGHGFKADLAIRQGEAEDGVESLQGSVEKLHSMPYELLTTTLNASLSQGLRATGRFAEGMALIDETIAVVNANGDVIYMPELLRVKGGLLLSMPQPKSGEAEMCFTQSLELSRRQALVPGNCALRSTWRRCRPTRDEPRAPRRFCSLCSSSSSRASIQPTRRPPDACWRP